MIKTTSVFLKGTRIKAITIFPFILYRDKEDMKDEILLNHEKIHIRQQLEMLVIPFYIWYGIEAIFRRYKSISFEAETFAHENDLDYLRKRKPYSWIKYL
mgnify:CR=1 FL=1